MPETIPNFRSTKIIRCESYLTEMKYVGPRVDVECVALVSLMVIMVVANIQCTLTQGKL